MSLGILTKYGADIKRALVKSLRGDTQLRLILRYHVGLADECGQPADATGKLLRPSLVLFVAEQLGATVDQAMPAAIGLELVHNFSLIHDDIQDADRTRRGRPTVWALWGTSEAINAGDLMQALAVATALRAGDAAAGVLLTATAAMIEGQSLDLSFEDRQVALDEYLGMIDRKTGALFCAAFDLGGVIAAADSSVRKYLATLGQAIGRAFQIQDDLLGVWGDSNVVGKPSGTDIRRCKKSYPTILAFERANASDLQALQAIYAQEEMSESDVTRVIEMMVRFGIRETGQEAVQDYLDKASEALEGLPFSAAGHTDMAALIRYLARRNK